MKGINMSRNFFEDSDIHGLKHLTRETGKKRLSWITLILLSTMGFTLFASFRIRYYFSYPYISISRVDDSSHPIPALAICAATKDFSTANFNALPSWMWESNTALSDQEAIELAWLRYRIKISTIDQHTGELILDTDAMKMLNVRSQGDATSHSRENESTNETTVVDIVIERLKRISVNFRTTLNADNICKKCGLMLEHIKCSRVQAYQEIDDCTRYMSRKFTDAGSCIVYDSIIGKVPANQTQFNGFTIRQTWGDYISLTINTTTFNTSQWTFFAMLYGPGGYPSWNAQAVQFISLDNTAPGAIYVERSTFTTSLGKPYKEKDCLSGTQTDCLERCWAEQNNCSFSYFKNRHGYLPCRLDLEMWGKLSVPDAVSVCIEKCSNPCKYEEFKIKESMFYDSNDQKHASRPTRILRLIASTNLKHEVIEEEPLYTYDALLSEIGGTLGLFIGASLLSLVDLLGYISMAVGNKLAGILGARNTVVRARETLEN